eukprot:g3145.t1
MSWSLGCFGGKVGCGSSSSQGRGGVLRNTPVKNPSSPYGGGDDDTDGAARFQDHHRWHRRRASNAGASKKPRPRGPDSHEVKTLHPPTKLGRIADQTEDGSTKRKQPVGAAGPSSSLTSSALARKREPSPSDSSLDSLASLMSKVTLDDGARRRYEQRQELITDEAKFTSRALGCAEKDRISHHEMHAALSSERHLDRRQDAIERTQRILQKEEYARQNEAEEIESHSRRLAEMKAANSEAERQHELALARARKAASKGEEGIGFVDLPEYTTVQNRLAVRFRPLTDAESAQASDATDKRRGAASDSMVTEFNIPITRKDMRKLYGTTWVNDEIVNFCMQLINARDIRDTERRAAAVKRPEEAQAVGRRVWCTNSFFMVKLRDNGGYRNVRRWSKKAKVPDIFALQRMVVPVNIGNTHWTSVQVDFSRKEIVFYDSMGGPGDEYLEAVLGYLKAEHEKKKETPMPGADKWVLRNSGRSVPQQKNGSDCGMFTCAFSIFLTDPYIQDQRGRLGLPLDFHQRDIPLFRKRLACDILRAHLD